MTSFNMKQLVLGMLRTNCYIIFNDNKDAIIVDPGDNFSKVKDMVLNEGLNVKAVLLTHGHFDHIGAADEIRKEYGAKIYAHELEKEILEDSFKNLSSQFYEGIALKADDFFKEGDILEIAGFKIRVIHTPGHTVGGVAFYFGDYGVLFSGDTMFNGSYGRVDFPTGSMSTLMSSIKEKLLKLPDETVVFPGHNDSTTIGDEKRWY